MGLIESSMRETVNSLPEVDIHIKEPRTYEDWVYMDIGYGIDSNQKFMICIKQ